MYERNGIETIADNDGIMWLNEKHLEEGLDHKKFVRNYNKISFTVYNT